MSVWLIYECKFTKNYFAFAGIVVQKCCVMSQFVTDGLSCGYSGVKTNHRHWLMTNASRGGGGILGLFLLKEGSGTNG